MHRYLLIGLALVTVAGVDVASADSQNGPPRDYYGLYQTGSDPVFASYRDGVKWAQADRRPLVAFVGISPKAIPGCIVSAEESLDGLQPGVYVSWFNGKGHTAAQPFATTPSPDQVAASLLEYNQVLPPELARVTARPVAQVPQPAPTRLFPNLFNFGFGAQPCPPAG